MSRHNPLSQMLEQQSLARTLFVMTWPMLFGVLALMSFQLVDSVFISMLGTEPLASFGVNAIATWALGIRLETFSLVIVLALTMSIPPMLGRMLGAKNLHQAHALVWLAIRFILLLQVAIALFWLATRPWIVPWLAQETATAEYLASYMLWVPISYSALGVCILLISSCNALGMPLRAVTVSITRLFLCYLPCIVLGAYWNGMYLGVLLGNTLAGLLAWKFYCHGLRRLQHTMPDCPTRS